MSNRAEAFFRSAVLFICSFCLIDRLQGQTAVWDGGVSGNGTSWAVTDNWVSDTALQSSATSNVLINNRNGTGTISSLTISGTRTHGTITFDNVNSVLASTLNVDTNGSGTTARALTLHGGITLQNTGPNQTPGTTVAFRGNNGSLSIILGANNTFSASTGMYLQINSGVVISGGFGINISGGGTVGLNAPNTFTGGVTVENGATLRVGAANQGSSASSTLSGGLLQDSQVGTGTLILQNGSTLLSGGSGQRTLHNSLSLGGNITFGATSTYTGTLVFRSDDTSSGETLTTPAVITLTNDLNVTSNVTTSFFNVVSGPHAITKQGPGSLRLSANNTYNGGTAVASGTLEFGRTGSLGSGLVTLGSTGGGDASLLNYLGGWTLSNNIVATAGSGGTLTLGYTSTADYSGIFSGSITLNDDLNLRSDAATGFAMRVTGSISGSHDLTKTGPGMLRIEADNTAYTGTTTIAEGTLQLGSFSGSNAGSLGSGQVVNNAILRINRTNNFTISNEISGTGSFIQAGSGTTILTGQNSYSGGTSVIGGELLINNTTGSATGSGSVTTAVGTTLGGTGTLELTGSNFISIGGTVSPGIAGSAGVLSMKAVDGNVTFTSTSSLALELFANAVNDRLFYAGSGLGQLDFTSLGAGQISVTFASGYTPSAGDTFDLLDWTNLAGLSTTQLNLSTAGFDPNWTWDTSQFVASGVVSIIVIPEPSRVLLILLGVVAIVSRRERVNITSHR
ncbi:MAG: autotransporter-associated beta strand repeat-containing protein [Verrucomicrobiaceae bacterium]|nr:autotransporter-associated beta strand repeat-containing protein [Verrucomicrobiaceae bacterium]